MELEFLTISFRNFMSYGNNITVVNLSCPGTTLIIGEDLDRTTNGTGANGVGKTTILNAISYALYDVPVSDISVDNLVNNINRKNMEVTIEFRIGDILYKVKRERKTKAGAAGNNVYFYINGEDKTPNSVAETNKKIESILGISYELFVRIVVFYASDIPFLGLKKSEQTDIFEQLVGLTMLSDKATSLKTIIKENESIIKIKKTKLDMLEAEHARYAIQLNNARERMDKWVINNAQNILELESQLEKISGVDLDQQQSLHEELLLVNNQLTQEINLFEKIETKVTSFTRQLSKSKQELEHLRDNTCPYCLQQYTDTTSKISELNDTIITLQDNIKSSEQELIKLDALIAELEAAQLDIKKQLTTPNIRELLHIRSQSDGIESKIDTLKHAINPHIESYNEILNIEMEPIDYTEINKLTSEIKHQEFLLKLLTKKDSFVRKALLNQYIPYLNSRLQYYLSELGLPHRVEFTHQMTANISQFGRPLDFGNLSAGQRARVNLALSLAFSDVLQKLHIKINICLLDEVLDIGLDTIGVQAAARLLKKRAKEGGTSMYIISHRDEVSGIFDNILTVQMMRGFSYVKDNNSA